MEANERLASLAKGLNEYDAIEGCGRYFGTLDLEFPTSWQRSEA